MGPPQPLRPVTDDEARQLGLGFRSPSSFTLRRCQVLLASARGWDARSIAGIVGWRGRP